MSSMIGKPRRWGSVSIESRKPRSSPGCSRCSSPKRMPVQQLLRAGRLPCRKLWRRLKTSMFISYVRPILSPGPSGGRWLLNGRCVQQRQWRRDASDMGARDVTTRRRGMCAVLLQNVTIDSVMVWTATCCWNGKSFVVKKNISWTEFF